MNKELIKDALKPRVRHSSVLTRLLNWKEQGLEADALDEEAFSVLTRLEALWERRTSPDFINKQIAIKEHAAEFNIDPRHAYNDYNDCDKFFVETNKDYLLGQRAQTVAILDRIIYECQVSGDRKNLLIALKQKTDLLQLEKIEDESELERKKLANTMVALTLAKESAALFEEAIPNNEGIINVEEFINKKINSQKVVKPFDDIDFDEIDDDDSDI